MKTWNELESFDLTGLAKVCYYIGAGKFINKDGKEKFVIRFLHPFSIITFCGIGIIGFFGLIKEGLVNIWYDFIQFLVDISNQQDDVHWW